MERIQSAISKARATRKSRKEDLRPIPAAAASEPHFRPEGDTPAIIDPSTTAWNTLMEFRPDPWHLERHRIVTSDGGLAAAPFDSMRTRLLYLLRDKGWKRIAVTSPGPGCGKTTVSVNLALSLARLADVRSIVIDADLRRPAMAKTLGVSAGHQFSDVLAGTAEPSRHLLRIGTNLAIGTNHEAARHSAELLQSPQAVEALLRLEEDYKPSLTILDLSPMLVSDDATAALSLVDGVLIVAAAEGSTVSEIDRCEQDLAARTNVIGVVLNKCRYLEKGESYGYNYA